MKRFFTIFWLAIFFTGIVGTVGAEEVDYTPNLPAGTLVCKTIPLAEEVVRNNWRWEQVIGCGHTPVALVTISSSEQYTIADKQYVLFTYTILLYETSKTPIQTDIYSITAVTVD